MDLPYKQNTKRGKVFSKTEDTVICNAWLSITQDPVIGNSQAQSIFWKRIFDNYVSFTNDTTRSPSSIESRWRVINKCCSKYRGCLTQVENLHQSGVIEADVIRQAKELYLQNEKMEFRFDHCWEILQHRPQWREPPTTTRNSQSMEAAFQSPTSSSIPETFVDPSCDQATSGGSVDSPNKRLRGRKAEKESRRKQKVGEVVNSRFCNLMEQFNTHNEEVDKEKKELAERKVRVLEEMQKLEEKKEDDAIMSMDISGMDAQAHAYYSMRKNEVMAKIMARSIVIVLFVQMISICNACLVC